MGLFRAVFDPAHAKVGRARATWRQVAGELGLTYVEIDQPPDVAPRLRGEVDGVRVNVDIVWWGTGETRTRATEIEVPVETEWPSGITIETRRNPFMRAIEAYTEWITPSDHPLVRLRDPLLRRAFQVRAAQPQRAKQLLGDPALHAALVAAARLKGEWYIGGGRPRVRVKYDHVVTDAAKLLAAIRAVLSVRSALLVAFASRAVSQHEDFSWTWLANPRRNIVIGIAFMALQFPLTALFLTDVLPKSQTGLVLAALVAFLLLLSKLTKKTGQLRLTQRELSFRVGRRRLRLPLSALTAELRLGHNSFARELHLRHGAERLVLAADSDERILLPYVEGPHDCWLDSAAFAELLQRLRAAAVLPPPL